MAIHGLSDPGSVGHRFYGVLNDPDVNIVDMGGVAPTDFDELIDAVRLIEDANGVPEVRIEAPRTAAQYAKLVDTTGQPKQPPTVVEKLRHLRSTQVPINVGAGANKSVSVVGNFRTGFVILGIRSAFRVEVPREAGDAFDNLGRKIRIWGRADMAIGRPKHLSLITGIA